MQTDEKHAANSPVIAAEFNTMATVEQTLSLYRELLSSG